MTGITGEIARTDSWARSIGAITLFVEDLPRARRFYGLVFDLTVVFEDDSSAWEIGK